MVYAYFGMGLSLRMLLKNKRKRQGVFSFFSQALYPFGSGSGCIRRRKRSGLNRGPTGPTQGPHRGYTGPKPCVLPVYPLAAALPPALSYG